MTRIDWLEGKKKLNRWKTPEYLCMQCGSEVYHNPPSGPGWMCSTGCIWAQEGPKPSWAISSNQEEKLMKVQNTYGNLKSKSVYK